MTHNTYQRKNFFEPQPDHNFCLAALIPASITNQGSEPRSIIITTDNQDIWFIAQDLIPSVD